MAMTMFNRARWTRKPREAEIFRRWLLARLAEAKVGIDDRGSKMEDLDLQYE
jgi:hypothetical protein